MTPYGCLPTFVTIGVGITCFVLGVIMVTFAAGWVERLLSGR